MKTPALILLTLKLMLMIVCCMLGLVIAGGVGYGQDSEADYVNAHNGARAEVGVENVAWDDSVAAFAQNYANERKVDSELIHSGGGGKYGENLAMSSGDLSGTDAVKLWVDEKPYYDYYSNSCVEGKECLHYTQVVWRKSVGIGCAKVRCDNGGTFITCNYSLPLATILVKDPTSYLLPMSHVSN